jgi:hypothetical protein
VEPQNSQQAAELIPVRQSSRQSSQTINGTKYRYGNDRVRTKPRAFLEKLSADEAAMLRARDRSQFSTSPTEAKVPQPNRKTSYKSMRRERQYLSDEDSVLVDGHDSTALENNSFIKLPTALAGSLPGVYHNYLLVRPDPSLHILFASALQHTMDLRQTLLLSHTSRRRSHRRFPSRAGWCGSQLWRGRRLITRRVGTTRRGTQEPWDMGQRGWGRVWRVRVSG